MFGKNFLKLLFVFSLQLIATGSVLSQGPGSQPKIAEAAPLFKLTGLDREAITLEKLRGKFVVIHFAATWCPFCNAEAKHLEALWQKYKTRNVQVLIIDVKEDAQIIEKWVKARGVTFPVLLDSDGAVSASYAPEDILPDLARDEVCLASNLIIDPEGKIQFFSLLDTKKFDAKLIALTERLDELLSIHDETD